jgi:hypothetical protein
MDPSAHASVGLTVKAAVSKVPLAALLLTTELPDLLFFGLHFPRSHGLFMCLVWSILAGGLAWLFCRKRIPGIFVGLAVFSGWSPDFLAYSNLPVFWNDSPMIGVGLITTGTGVLIGILLEVILIAVGIIAIWLLWKKGPQATMHNLRRKAKMSPTLPKETRLSVVPNPPRAPRVPRGTSLPPIPRRTGRPAASPKKSPERSPPATYPSICAGSIPPSRSSLAMPSCWEALFRTGNGFRRRGIFSPATGNALQGSDRLFLIGLMVNRTDQGRTTIFHRVLRAGFPWRKFSNSRGSRILARTHRSPAFFVNFSGHTQRGRIPSPLFRGSVRMAV